MKKLLMLSLLSFTAFAQDLPPEYMKDGTITVKLKDGKEYSFSTNEFKVVKRGSGEAAKKTAYEQGASDVVAAYSKGGAHAAKHEPKHNRLMVHAGVGFDGHSVKESGNEVEVKERRAPVFGVSYFRLLDEDVSVGGSVFSNGTFTLGVGKDF